MDDQSPSKRQIYETRIGVARAMPVPACKKSEVLPKLRSLLISLGDRVLVGARYGGISLFGLRLWLHFVLARL